MVLREVLRLLQIGQNLTAQMVANEAVARLEREQAGAKKPACASCGDDDPETPDELDALAKALRTSAENVEGAGQWDHGQQASPDTMRDAVGVVDRETARLRAEQAPKNSRRSFLDGT